MGAILYMVTKLIRTMVVIYVLKHTGNACLMIHMGYRVRLF